MLAVEIAKYLHEQGLGVFDEAGVHGNIHIANLPPAPDEVIGIYPRGGGRSDSKLNVDEEGIQIIVRGSQDPRPAHEKAQAIYDLLHGFTDARFIEDGKWIVGCTASQPPIYLEKDENKRNEYGINFTLLTVNENRRA